MFGSIKNVPFIAGANLRLGTDLSAIGRIGLRFTKGKTKRRTRMKKNVGTQEMVKLEYFSLPLSKEITLAHIKVFLKNFKKGRVLEKKDLRELLGRFHDLMHGGGNSSAVQDIQVPEDGTVTVVGDTHGQLADLLTIFRLNGTYCCVWYGAV